MIKITCFAGGIIMFGALLLFEDEFIHVVSISFTALIITELLMVALTIRGDDDTIQLNLNRILNRL